MKPINASLLIISLLFVLSPMIASASDCNNPSEQDSIPKLENPMSVAYLNQNLRKESPRLILNRKIGKQLKKKLKKDAVVKNWFKAIELNAVEIQQKPLLERKKIGRRLLSVSREMLYRMNMLGMVYHVKKDKKILARINEEVQAVCQFSDWNPSHYLDVAEMAMAVAFAIDWTAGDLPATTITLAKKALIEKGINPSYNKEGNVGWINGTNNWNQVCHGGMIAASIIIAEDNPALAATTIHRALEGIPHSMVEYGPDGVYPEGSTYWGYGTSFSVLTAAMLESSFGTDFGIGNYPAFKESAMFRVLCNAPSGWYYNFADCGDQRKENGDITLAWFAAKTGNPIYFEKERFLSPAEDMGKLARYAGAGLVWLSQFQQKETIPPPSAWKGEGANPIVFFKGDQNDPYGYYFGGKGGRGTVNHGNMDSGSFIFELNGVRWVVDPGNQAYHDLEKTGFNLWGRCQDCERWDLLTKNNYGHSTLTVDNKLHIVDGMTSISNFKDGPQPEVTLDMTPTFEGQLTSAKRRFVKDGPQSLIIEDNFETNDQTKMVTWQLMTTADVAIKNDGAVLAQNNKTLKLTILSPSNLTVSVISLATPPHPLDRKIAGLKRIEIRCPSYLFEEGKGEIKVRLSGE